MRKAMSAMVMLAASMACAGTIIEWGINNDPPSGNDYIAVAAGKRHALALNQDGSLAAWGTNNYGLLDIPDGNDFVLISASGDSSIALRSNGTVIRWGQYNETWTPPPDIEVVDISTNTHRWSAVLSDGSLAVGPEGNYYRKVACGSEHTLVLKSDGSLGAWGSNNYGASNVPWGYDYVAIAAGHLLSIALKSNGTVVSWGGDPNPDPDMVFDTDPPPQFRYVAISAEDNEFLAITTEGRLIAWGKNKNNQRNTPPGIFTQIDSGEYGCVALTGESYCKQPPFYDTNDDCKIDLGDLANLAMHWMECNLEPPEACI